MKLAAGYRFYNLTYNILSLVLLLELYWPTLYMFIFQYSDEIVQFSSNSATSPDEGDVQFLRDFHPQYVHLEQTSRF
jgi:hypothetical protein